MHSERGQFSVDLLLAVSAVFTFILALQLIASSALPIQAEQSAILQERELAQKIASVFNESKILFPGTFQINYTIPNLKIPGKGNTISCSVRIETTPRQAVVSYNLDGHIMEDSAQIQLTVNEFGQLIYPGTLNCGETLKIEKR